MEHSSTRASSSPTATRPTTDSWDPLHKRYAFIVPRYFASLAGGAETLIGALATKLHARGTTVEVLTTCAKDNRSWENFFPEGLSEEGGITIRRFPVEPRNLELWIPCQIQISEGMQIGVENELLWMNESVNSYALYSYLAQHAASFDALFFGPYLFGTTFWGSQISPQNSFLIPCLHDEYAAYTSVIAGMFRSVRGALFNAAPEGDLARALYGSIEGYEVGMGFAPIAHETQQALTPFFSDSSPYLLYVGRKETGKNVQILIDYFIEGKERSLLPEALRLVIVGGGDFSDLHRPEAKKREDIIDLAHVSELDKQRIITHALALCQPSTNESFSIVMMEAWLLGVPSLVHASCSVTRSHTILSGGGLYFGDSNELIASVSLLLDSPALRSQMGEAGKRYVHTRYNWDAVLNRFDTAMESFLR